MAKNQRYTHAEHVSAPLPYDRTPGQPVLIGAIAGIALNGGKKDEAATVWLDGSWNVDVAGAATPGQIVNISAAGALSTGAGTPWGVSFGTKGTGTGVLEVAPLGLTAPAATGA